MCLIYFLIIESRRFTEDCKKNNGLTVTDYVQNMVWYAKKTVN